MRARSIAILALLLVASSPSPPKAQVGRAAERHHRASGRIVATPQNQPSPVSTPAETRNYAYNYYYPEKSSVPPFTFQIVTTVILLLFTGGLWITTIMQWRAMEKSLRVTQQAALGIKGFNVTLSNARNKWIMAFIENYGKVAAIKIRLRLDAMGSTDDPKTINYGAITPPRIAQMTFGEIMPGVPHSVPINLDNITDEEVAQISDGTLFLYIVGFITYENGFGDEVTLPVRFHYDPGSPPYPPQMLSTIDTPSKPD
jgi:hypothetical protein